MQPNIDPYAKAGRVLYLLDKQVNILTQLSDSLGQVNTEFFIWPETAISDPINEDNILTDGYFLQAQHFLNKYKNGNIITGAETFIKYLIREKHNTASQVDGRQTV